MENMRCPFPPNLQTGSVTSHSKLSDQKPSSEVQRTEGFFRIWREHGFHGKMTNTFHRKQRNSRCLQVDKEPRVGQLFRATRCPTSRTMFFGSHSTRGIPRSKKKPTRKERTTTAWSEAGVDLDREGEERQESKWEGGGGAFFSVSPSPLYPGRPAASAFSLLISCFQVIYVSKSSACLLAWLPPKTPTGEEGRPRPWRGKERRSSDFADLALFQ